MPLDSKVIENEAPKNDMITVDLKTKDIQLDPKQKPIPEKVIESEAPKNDMVAVDLNTQDTQLNSKPNSMPKKTMTPRYKFKRIKKSGKIQKIQSPGVPKMKFTPSHKIKDSQNTPIKSPNIACDSTALDTGIPKSDSSKMVLEVQDTKQNYKTKALKMSKGSMPQMSLIKRRGKCGKVRKIQTPRMYQKKLKSQLDMRAQWSLKSKHNNNARLHNNTLNTKFIELRGIMESVIGAFHNTFPLLDRLLLKRPRVKIKWYPFSRECTHWYLTHFWLKDLIFGNKLISFVSHFAYFMFVLSIFYVWIVYILIHTTLLSKHSARSLCKPQKVKEIGSSTNHSYWPIKSTNCKLQAY